jgi:hypothetical protein
MLYYVEFYRPRTGIDHDTFRETINRTDKWWIDHGISAKPIVKLARTWRLSGGPDHVVVWPLESFSELDKWTELRNTNAEVRRAIEEWRSVIDIDAGLYADFGEEIV